MKRSDVVEETIYCWECPKCGNFNEMSEDPSNNYELCCDECDHEEELED